MNKEYLSYLGPQVANCAKAFTGYFLTLIFFLETTIKAILNNSSLISVSSFCWPLYLLVLAKIVQAILKSKHFARKFPPLNHIMFNG